MSSETVVLRKELCTVYGDKDRLADIVESMRVAIDAYRISDAEKDAEIDIMKERYAKEKLEWDAEIDIINERYAKEKLEWDAKIIIMKERYAKLHLENDKLKGIKREDDVSDIDSASQRAKKSKLDYTKKEDDVSDISPAELKKQEKIIKLTRRIERLTKQLDKETKKHKRTSNANTPPSQGSDAQGCLKKYRNNNPLNHPDEKDNAAKESKAEEKTDKVESKEIPVTEVQDHTVIECPDCGENDVNVKTETKDVKDVKEKIKVTETRYITSKGKCKNGHKIDTTPKGLTKGSSLGPNLMTFVVYMFFTTLSLSSIASSLQMFGLSGTSKSTILVALTAVALQKFTVEADRISKKLGESLFLLADETPIRIGKNGGYAWAFIGQYGIKIVIAESRGRSVVNLHCPYFHIPITVDGYSVYKVFAKRQRCWAHILREAELLAATHGGHMAELHQRLQAVFHNAKKLSPDIPEEELKGWIDNVVHISKIYTKLNPEFSVTLYNAASDLFTFVRHPGVEPTNNRSERTLRKVVLHKKIRLMFRSAMGMHVYGILMTCMMTWDYQGQDLMDKIHETIMAN